MSTVARYSKALGALIPAVVTLLVALGIDVSPEVTGALVGLASTIGVILAPANAPPDDLGWSVVDGEPVPD